MVDVAKNGGFDSEVKSFFTYGAVQCESSFRLQIRSFHGKSRLLDYWASMVLQAEFIVDVDSYDESSKGRGNDESLGVEITYW